MSEELFTQTLREFIHRKPFIPFSVRLTNGQTILVDHPSLVFSGGAAGYLGEADFIAFRSEEVAEIAACQEASS